MSHVRYDRPYPEACRTCGDEAPTSEHWKWNPNRRANFGGTWRCREDVNRLGRAYMRRRRADPVRNARNIAYHKQYAADRPNWLRYKAYRSVDNRRFGGHTLPWAVADVLMNSECHYCGLSCCGGLDRRDNELGHSGSNVVPCCFVCNTILGDLSEEVKDLLAEGLRTARAKGLLDSWIPPQKRSQTVLRGDLAG